MIARLKQALACRRLQRIVDERCKSFEVQDYRRRREAAKKALARRYADGLSCFASSHSSVSRPKASIPRVELVP